MSLDHEITPIKTAKSIDTYNAVRSMTVDVYSDLGRIHAQIQEQDAPVNTHAYNIAENGDLVTVAVFNSGYPDEYYSLLRDRGRLLLSEPKDPYSKEEIICFHNPPFLMVRFGEVAKTGATAWSPYYPVTDEASVQKVLDYTDGIHVEIVAVTDENDAIIEQKRGIGGFVRKLLMHIAK